MDLSDDAMAQFLLVKRLCVSHQPLNPEHGVPSLPSFALCSQQQLNHFLGFSGLRPVETVGDMGK